MQFSLVLRMSFILCQINPANVQYTVKDRAVTGTRDLWNCLHLKHEFTLHSDRNVKRGQCCFMIEHRGVQRESSLQMKREDLATAWVFVFIFYFHLHSRVLI